MPLAAPQYFEQQPSSPVRALRLRRSPRRPLGVRRTTAVRRIGWGCSLSRWLDNERIYLGTARTRKDRAGGTHPRAAPRCRLLASLEAFAASRRVAMPGATK